MHILFVCTGNICRSPTAERLAAAYGAQFRMSNFTTSSAGIRAVIGSPIHRNAASVLNDLGGDASEFAARQLTAKIVSRADLILTMTTAHRDAVLGFAPQRLSRTFTLCEASKLASGQGARSVADLAGLRSHLAPHDRSDIDDPMGQSAETFALVGKQIADFLPPILEMCRRSSPPIADSN